jgi:hypothetical protein
VRAGGATAETLLDEALSLHPDPSAWLDRARIRTRRGEYAAAYRDVERARPVGAAALEVGARASYFDRRFEQAAAFAADGATLAEDAALRARCLTVAGRTRHAAGDLSSAEQLLGQAIEQATGPDRMIASAWLGVLRSHQSFSRRPLACCTTLRWGPGIGREPAQQFSWGVRSSSRAALVGDSRQTERRVSNTCCTVRVS